MGVSIRGMRCARTLCGGGRAFGDRQKDLSQGFWDVTTSKEAVLIFMQGRIRGGGGSWGS